MNADNPISPELQARIDALPEGSTKDRVIRVLTGPGIRQASNEEIFDHIMASVAEAEAQRATWRKWSDEEVLAFIDHFKKELPGDYAEYLRQERENNEIDADLSWKLRRLSSQWIPDLDFHDRSLLLGKVRDFLQTEREKSEEERP